MNVSTNDLSKPSLDHQRVGSIYFNKPQLEANLIDARKQRHVMGRGTGKTTGILAHRFHRCMTLMPRATGFNVAESYMQLLDRTMPPIIARWEEMGLRRDVDFWFRKFPPRNIGLKMPYVTPETAEHSVFMRVDRYNVSALKMISQDRPGSSNGSSNDFGGGDEAKFLDKQKLDSELAPTLRGNRRYFKDCHLHHSEIFTTDMPTNPGGKWIHEYEEYIDPAANELILAGEKILYDIRVKARKRGKFTNSELHQIELINRELSLVRKDLVFYSEASSLDNIDVLGVDYIKDLKRDLTDFVFRTSVLNERPGKVDNTFYPDLAESHFYNAIDYSFADGQNEEKYGKNLLNDCRRDLDLDKTKPIEVGLDVGGKINNLVAGQEAAKMISMINALHVLHPKKISDLARSFAQYYRYYHRKEVIVYYDHTHIPKNPISDANPIDEFTKTLEQLGWKVIPYMIGVTPSYYNRYQLWSAVLTGKALSESEFYRIGFNKENTKTLRTAMEVTQFALNGRTGFEKDKRGESNPDPKAQEQAPHYTDAADVLLFGMIKRRRAGSRPQSSLVPID